MVKNKTIYWIIGIVILLFFIFGKSTPRSGINVVYYDKDGYVIGEDTVQDIMGTQAIFQSPSVTHLYIPWTPDTVNQIQLKVTVENTGNIPTEFEVSSIMLGSSTYSATPVSQIIEPGQTGTFDTELIDISEITGEDYVEIEVSGISDIQGVTAKSHQFNWLFDRYLENGDSCSSAGDCINDYCVHGACSSNQYIIGDGYCDSGENCGNSGDCTCSSGETCYNNQCVVVECSSVLDCYPDGWSGLNPYIGSAFCLPSEGENTDKYKMMREYTCQNPGTANSMCSYTDKSVKITDCGDTSYSSWGSAYCQDDNVWHSRTKYEKGCSSGSCYSHEVTQSEEYDSCDTYTDGYCSNGQCEICSASEAITETFESAIIEDSWVEEEDPNENHGSGTNLYLEEDDDQDAEAFFKIDTSNIIDDTMKVIDVKFYVSYGGGSYSEKDALADSVPCSSWSENSITWNNRPTGPNSGTVDPVIPFETNDFSNILGLVEDKTALKSGACRSYRIRTTSSSQWSIKSRESKPEPYIELSYCEK